MRVAAIYDVHGNLPALEAVLAEIETIGPDLIVIGGDVALGPMPSETIAALRALGSATRFVRGNCDRALVRSFDVGTVEQESALADAWVVARLTQAERDFLAGFEDCARVEVDVLGATLFCHGSPRSDEEILTRITSEERLDRLLRGVEERVVVCGHTHVQFDRAAADVRLVNAGSVGLPYEERPGAYWALLGPEVELRRTGYDLERAARRIRATGWPPAEEIIRENLLRSPSPEEASREFEQLALTRERQG
jgi:putative phosphoesterase